MRLLCSEAAQEAHAQQAATTSKSKEQAEEEDDGEEGGGTAASRAAGRQRWALESIYSLVTRQRGHLPSALLEAVMAWLMHTAFFTTRTAHPKPAKGKPKSDRTSTLAVPEVGDALRELCMARFFSMVELLSGGATLAGSGGSGGSGGARPRAAVAESRLESVPAGVLASLRRIYPPCVEVCAHTAKLAASTPALQAVDPQVYWPMRAHLVWKALEELQVQPVVPWEATVIKVRSDMWTTTTQLLAAAGPDTQSQSHEVLQGRQSRALALLFLYNGLELLSDPQSAIHVVLELQQCHDRVLALRGAAAAASSKKKKKAPPKSKRKVEEDAGEEQEQEDEDEVMAVLVELLVSLLARPSAMLRNVVKATLRAFADNMTPSSIQVLVQVLSESGADLFANGDDDDDMDDDDDEDEEEEDEDGDEDEDDDEEQVAAALSKKESKTGKDKAGSKRKAAASGEDDDEDEEEEASEESDSDGGAEDDWDDDKMFEIDHLVAAAFKSRLEETRVAKQTSSMSLVLKLRTLELVEVLLTRKEPSAQLLLLLEPLLDLAITGAGGDKKVGESAQQRVSFHAKVSALYADKLCRVRPAPPVTSAPQAKEATAMLERLCERMPQQGQLVGAGIQFVLRVLSASSKSFPAALAGGVEQVGALLDKWASKKHSNINPLFFTQLCDRLPAIGWALAPRLVAHAESSASEFHKSTCLELLLALARQSGMLKQDAGLKPHLDALLGRLGAVLQSAAEQASADEGRCKKMTRMLQAALALAHKCLEIEADLGMAALDHEHLSRIAGDIAATSTAARAKSVLLAAQRLQQRLQQRAGTSLKPASAAGSKLQLGTGDKGKGSAKAKGKAKGSASAAHAGDKASTQPVGKKQKNK